MRTSSLPVVFWHAFVLVSAFVAGAAAQPILELDDAILDRGIVKAQAFDHPGQPVFMALLSRGTFIDGTAREPWLFGPQLAANPSDPAALGDAYFASVRLATGQYTPTSIDLALPCPGPAWPIARSRTALDGEANSVHGPGWYQDSQPQLVFEDDPQGALDRVTLVYGGDRFAQFVQVVSKFGVASEVFRGVNGAAGAVVKGSVTASLPGCSTIVRSPACWKKWRRKAYRALRSASLPVEIQEPPFMRLWRPSNVGTEKSS